MLLTEWHLIQRDLRDQGIDVHDQALMHARPWLWLRDAILGLVDRPHAYAPDGFPAFTTRIQQHLYGPGIERQRKAHAAKANQRR